MKRVLYLAAHGGFAGQAVPLGGGAAIANLLCEHWGREARFELSLIGPAILGANAPQASDLVRFNERDYARFCHAFREASTREVLRHDPRECAVLVNDISEGPDFARLHAAGFRIVTIYHVDVVAYIAAIYLRNWIGAPALARLWERMRPVLRHVTPAVLDLVFEQQRASLQYSSKVVVPSSGMRDVLMASYPETPRDRIEVLPWGASEVSFSHEEVAAAVRTLRQQHRVPDGALVLTCLSRISPEKGQDLLLKALIGLERSGQLPSRPLWLFICGESAFMQGERHMRKLEQMASELRHVRVVFPGYVTGLAKLAYLRMADLYVFPSRHESYGLTLVEALAAGRPCLALDHHGARQILTPALGRMVATGDAVHGLQRALVEMLTAPDDLREMGRAAAQWARRHPIAESIRRLEDLLDVAATVTDQSSMGF